jgi:hypothetical protein
LALLESTLSASPGVQAVELLNEPLGSRVQLSAESYVQDFLRPGFELVRTRFPGMAVVAAAPLGTLHPDRYQQLTDAGADEFCDFRAVHVYFDDEAALSVIRGSTRRPVLVTETGTGIPSQQVRWYSQVVPTLRSVLSAQLVFWYVLLDFTGYSVIASTSDAHGQPRAAPGSGLYSLLTGTSTALRRH